MSRDLLLYTIYDRTTSDYPGEFVCRRYYATTGEPVDREEPYARGRTLDEIRQQLPGHLYNLGREKRDDPVIVETWV